jgi:hypothetical protein
MDEYVNKNDEKIIEYKKKLKNEINNIVIEKWSF